MARSLEHRKYSVAIGNGAYYRPDNKLAHAVGNVKTLSSSLKQIGFNVTTANDLRKQDMTKRIMDMSQRINDGDLFLFYFCGQAYQMNGKIYLIPVDDRQIDREKDVEAVGTDLGQIIECIVAMNPSYVNIFILDFPGTYLLKSGASSRGERKGLEAMQPIEGAFIQFACGANETVRQNVFIKHLLSNIREKNLSIVDVFQRTTDGVAQESNRKQQPLSINGLTQSAEIYLHQVLPPAPKWDHIRPNEMQPFLRKQEELRAYYDKFPDIDEMINRDAPDVKRAEELTRTILGEVPSGDTAERSTLCHVIKNLFEKQGQECLFFDSTQGMRLYDASGALIDLESENKAFVLKLHSNEDFLTRKDARDPDYDLRVMKTLNRLIEQKKTHPVLDDIRERLSKAHRTDRDNVVIKHVYIGSCNIVYSVSDLRVNAIKQLIGVSTKLKEQFKQYVAAKVHPLLLRPYFDISQFDVLGNKTFTELETHQVGPPGREKTYTTPVGYTRYGLRVLGRYNDDVWLRPFGDPGNWYRAFHGTNNAKGADCRDPAISAMSKIHRTQFQLAETDWHGSGVYCSPKPSYVEKYYAADAKIDTVIGLKKFKLMLQVAVNPDDVKFATDNIWVALHAESIRAYGILIKDL